MKRRILPILLLILGFSQLSAVKWGSGPKKDEPKIKVTVLNKSGYDLKNVRLRASKVIKFGIKKVASINIEGKDVPVAIPVVGKPHGITFKNIKKGKLESKLVDMKRFDVNKLSFSISRGKFSRNITKNIRIGRLKFDAIYWSGSIKKGVKRSYAFKDIQEVFITILKDHTEVTIKSADYSIAKKLDLGSSPKKSTNRHGFGKLTSQSQKAQ